MATDNARPETLRAALESLAAGRTFFSPAYVRAREQRRADPCAFDKLLTAAEVEVLVRIARGHNDEEIARQLAIRQGTAQHHRSQILQKLHLAGTPKLLAWAHAHGFAVFAPAGTLSSGGRDAPAAPRPGMSAVAEGVGVRPGLPGPAAPLLQANR